MQLKPETLQDLFSWLRVSSDYRDFENDLFTEILLFYARNGLSKAAISRLMRMRRTTLMERAKRLGLTYRGTPCEAK